MVQPQELEERHTPVGNRREPEAGARFLATRPSMGRDTSRAPVQLNGTEAVPGYVRPNPPLPLPGQKLRDIVELTYGTAATAAGEISGSDRKPVPDTKPYPWRANARLLITVPGHAEPFCASGWFIGPYAVVTAAHALYPNGSGALLSKGWVTSIDVIPAQNGTEKPFITAVSTTFYVPAGWRGEGDQALNYGVALLSTGLGSIVGSYGYACYTDDDLRLTTANIAGYPAEAPDGKSPGGLLWYAARQISDVDENFVYYDVPAAAGDSGSPVYRNIGSQPFALAIHSAVNPGINRGLRITDPVYHNLQLWAAMRA